MKTESLDKIRSLKRCAAGFRTFFENFKKVTSDPNCDKHHAKFGHDSRFMVFQVTTFFSANTGYYGNSGCSTFSNGISGELAKKYFEKVLEKHKPLLFAEMAALMEEEATKLTGEAEKEIAELNALLSSVKEAA